MTTYRLNKRISFLLAIAAVAPVLASDWAGGGAHAVFAAPPVALASSASGTAQVRGPGESAFRPLHLFQKLEPGDVVRCEGEAVLTMIGTGARFMVPPGTVATVTEGGVAGARKASALRGPTARVWGAMGAARVSGILGRPGVAARPILADRKQFNGYYISKPNDAPPVFRWEPEQTPGVAQNVAAYGFTLYDRLGNVVFHARTSKNEAVYPSDLPAPSLRQAYTWRLVPYGKTGKMVASAPSRWGVVTFLTPEDAEAMEAQAKELQAQADPNDTSALVILAYVYLNYGVYQRALEVLDDPVFSPKDKTNTTAPRPGVDDMRETMYIELGPMGAAFAHPFNPEDQIKKVVSKGSAHVQ